MPDQPDGQNELRKLLFANELESSDEEDQQVTELQAPLPNEF